MPLDQVEFEFPDEVEEKQSKTVAVADASPEIEIVDDTPPEDRGRPPMDEPPKEVTDEELSKYDESVQKRIKHFTKGYHEERRAKESAQREKDEALKLAQSVIEENKQLKGSLSQGQQALLEQAKKVVASELDEVRRRYKEAYEAGDTDALLKAQEDMTSVKLKSEKVNNFKPAPLQTDDFDVQTKQVTNQPSPVDPKLQTWQDKNTWFGSNKRMTAYALGLHEDLVSEGVPVGGDTYYKRIDADIRNRFPDMFESGEPEDAVTPPKKSNVVAPATRGTAPKKVVLTKTQVEIAKRLGVPLELYARKVAEQMRG
jgi:hypothetical protein